MMEHVFSQMFAFLVSLSVPFPGQPMGASVSHTFYQRSQVCSGTAHPLGYVEIGAAKTRSAQTHPPNTHSHTTSNGGPLAVLRRHIFHFQPPKPTFATAATLHHNTTPQDCLSPAASVSSNSSSSYHLTLLVLVELNGFQRRCIFPTQPP